MSVELTVLIGVAGTLTGMVLGFLGFKYNRDKHRDELAQHENDRIRHEAERWAKIEYMLENLGREITELKEALAETTRNYRLSLERLHKRLDDHIRDDHKKSLPTAREEFTHE